MKKTLKLLAAGSATVTACGTNIKGHMAKFDYSLTDALTFSLTAYLNSLIVPPTHFVNNVSYSSAAVHVMGDLQWKF